MIEWDFFLDVDDNQPASLVFELRVVQALFGGGQS